MYNKPRIIILKNKINILNYDCIDHFDETKIIIKIQEKYIVITGKNLVISKLVIDEVLIEGILNKIEFR